MSWTNDYLRLRFEMGGRARPSVDCWGLYRLIVGELRGIWLDEFGGVESYREIARTMGDGAVRRRWLDVAPGDERALDLVMMSGIVGRGRGAVAAPIHVGCVIGPGLMIDIEEGSGVMVRAFRSTVKASAKPEVVNRVRGILRAEVLA